MTYGAEAVGVVAIAHEDTTSYSVLSDFAQLFLREGSRTRREFLVELYPFDDVTKQVEVMRYSQEPFEPTFNENVSALRRIPEALNYTASVNAGLFSLAATSGQGDMFVRVDHRPDDPTKGDSDDYMQRFFGNRVARVLMGGEGFEYSKYGVVQELRMRGIEPQAGGFRVVLRDPTLDLQKSAQPAVYSGAGNEEGGENLAGQPKPFAFGHCRNIDMVELDSVKNVYHVAGHRIKAVREVYDIGLKLTPYDNGNNDITDLALSSVWDWAPTVSDNGTYITDLERGILRLAAPAVSRPLADVDGYVRADGFHPNTHGQIVRTLHEDMTFGGIDSATLDLASYGRVELDSIYPAHLYRSRPTETLLQLTNDLLKDVFGFVWGTPEGFLAIGTLRERPIKDEIVESDFDAPPRGLLHFPIIKSRRYEYGQSHVVQRGDDLSELAEQEHVDFVGQEYRALNFPLDGFAVNHLDAEPSAVTTHFDDLTALPEWARQVLLLIHPRRLWEFRLKEAKQLRYRLGDTVRVTYPRYGFETGLTGIIVGVVERSGSRTVQLTVWVDHG